MSNIEENTTGKTFSVPSTTKIAIVQSQYNIEITGPLLESCIEELERGGLKEENISVYFVPGAFELPLGCQRIAQKKEVDAVIALGLVIKGETPHFDFVAGEAAHGIMEVGLKYNLPVILGLLTTNTLKQAKDRIVGGKRGDKGVEAAQTALQMV